jgi:hypothetical protein
MITKFQLFENQNSRLLGPQLHKQITDLHGQCKQQLITHILNNSLLGRTINFPSYEEFEKSGLDEEDWKWVFYYDYLSNLHYPEYEGDF